jgi:hypothetical protein
MTAGAVNIQVKNHDRWSGLSVRFLFPWAVQYLFFVRKCEVRICGFWCTINPMRKKKPPGAAKNPKSVQAGFRRAESLSAERRREIAAMGGRARAANMTPTALSRAMRKTVRSRWLKAKAREKGVAA